MCSPDVLHSVKKAISRRRFFACAAAALPAVTVAQASAMPREISTYRAIDLTHEIDADFPSFFGDKQIAFRELFSFSKNRFNQNFLYMNEHIGTHIDAPLHFSETGQYVSQIAIDDLFAPLVNIDIQERAAHDPDSYLLPSDITAWVKRFGPLPQRCFVAMNSGWSAYVKTPKFKNLGGDKLMHFPGFHPETAQMLVELGQVVGIGVDTLSLDRGVSTAFECHYTWLPTNRFGVECLANLELAPPNGAYMFIGAPKIKNATGVTCRVAAFVPHQEGAL